MARKKETRNKKLGDVEKKASSQKFADDSAAFPQRVHPTMLSSCFFHLVVISVFPDANRHAFGAHFLAEQRRGPAQTEAPGWETCPTAVRGAKAIPNNAFFRC